MLTDQELLRLFNANKDEGFRLIVEQFQERVYWQIRRLTKNHQDTEDVLQNVFIKVWNALPTFREESALYTWIFRITFNETHTFLTKSNKQKTIDADPPLFEDNASINGKNYTGEEIERLFKLAIDTLPEKQKLVFNLKYFDELKFHEIEKLTGTSVGALKASYHLAAKKIEEYLKQH